MAAVEEVPRESRSGSFASAVTLVGTRHPTTDKEDAAVTPPQLHRHVSTVQEGQGETQGESRTDSHEESISANPSDDSPTSANPSDDSSEVTVVVSPSSTMTPTPKDLTLELPSLPFDLWARRWRIVLGIGVLFFFDVAVPLILYYVLQYRTGLDDQDVLGYACLSVGIGELLELPVRGWRLARHPTRYNGIGCDSRWAFDALFWWYIVATVIGVVPYAVATSLPSGKPLYKVFLMVPGMVVGFASLACLFSLLPRTRFCRIGSLDYGIPSPVRLSSDPTNTPVKPFVYYVVEDFMAVDCKQGRPWREACRARWLASEPFRKLMWDLTLFWGVGGVVFTGVLAVFTWATPFSFAYGASFVWLFLWMMLWVALSLPFVVRALRHERQWFDAQQACTTT